MRADLSPTPLDACGGLLENSRPGSDLDIPGAVPIWRRSLVASLATDGGRI
ncbi:hypothetical protein [Natronococcus sp.]|uniref:hypothetical protein n=1 Tax=Natronococcus sp. TaxID=35747 RepID=UPI002600B15D|nr:hypothetical protein [Natronococcus sp.]